MEQASRCDSRCLVYSRSNHLRRFSRSSATETLRRSIRVRNLQSSDQHESEPNLSNDQAHLGEHPGWLHLSRALLSRTTDIQRRKALLDSPRSFVAVAGSRRYSLEHLRTHSQRLGERDQETDEELSEQSHLGVDSVSFAIDRLAHRQSRLEIRTSCWSRCVLCRCSKSRSSCPTVPKWNQRTHENSHHRSNQNLHKHRNSLSTRTIRQMSDAVAWQTQDWYAQSGGDRLLAWQLQFEECSGDHAHRSSLRTRSDLNRRIDHTAQRIDFANRRDQLQSSLEIATGTDRFSTTAVRTAT